MRRYGSLGLSKPHLEPIIGVILSQFNQSKRDWGVGGVRARVVSVGQTRWLDACVVKQLSPALWVSAAALTCIFIPGFPLCVHFQPHYWVCLKLLGSAGPGLREKAPESLQGHWGDNVRDAEAPRHHWHLSPLRDPGKDRLDPEKTRNSQSGDAQEHVASNKSWVFIYFWVLSFSFF